MEKEYYAKILLRIGLAGTFVYAAVSSFFNPENWIGFFPAFLLDFSSRFISQETLLGLFSAAELLLAFWLVSGFKTFFAGIAAAGLFAGIFFANLGGLDVVFRDAGLFFAALALAFLSR